MNFSSTASRIAAGAEAVAPHETPKPRQIYTRPSSVQPTHKSSYQLPLTYRYRSSAPKRSKLLRSESDEHPERMVIGNERVGFPHYPIYNGDRYTNNHRERRTDRHLDRHLHEAGTKEDDYCDGGAGEPDSARDSGCRSPSLPRKMAKLTNDERASDVLHTPVTEGKNSDHDPPPSSAMPEDLSKQGTRSSPPLVSPLGLRDGGERFEEQRLCEQNNGCEADAVGSDVREHKKQDWSFQEQFKQLYDLSDCPERKVFLDSLFLFMQRRGTPVNRIPIMAKQVLDLYELYNQVVAKGGLVEVINKKQWREITKGLNLPASITSAAFTLRTQYMKYLYPYECTMKALSTPAELQVAIDGNRREGRRPAYHAPHSHPLSFGLHPLPLSPSPTMIPHPSRMDLGHRLSPTASYAEDIGLPTRRASDSGMYYHERDTLSSPPPRKRPAYLLDDAAQRLQLLHPQSIHATAAHIKMTSQNAHPDTGFPIFEFRGDNTMVVSIELNGLLYQGVLYPCGSLRHPLAAATLPNRQPLIPATSHDH